MECVPRSGCGQPARCRPRRGRRRNTWRRASSAGRENTAKADNRWESPRGNHMRCGCEFRRRQSRFRFPMHPRLPGEGATSPDELVEQIPGGSSQPECFVKFGSRNPFSPFKLSVGLGDSTLDVLDFLRREILGKLFSQTRKEKGFVLARKLVCHLQDIMHAHGETMHYSSNRCKPFCLVRKTTTGPDFTSRRSPIECSADCYFTLLCSDFTSRRSPIE